MRTTFSETTQIQINDKKASNWLPEVTAYTGSVIALGAIGLGLADNWDEITQAQRTATFSLVAIAFFVAGLIASDTLEIRRRFSSYLYVLSAIASGLAVYVTFDDEPAPLQSFALATVVALLGYTVAPTMIGHAGLFLATTGTLYGLGFQTVDSENLRIYTQISLVIAFALTWIVMGALRIVHQDLAFLLGSASIFVTSQLAFLADYQRLSYVISFGIVSLMVWLYQRMPSLALVGVAFAAAIVSIAEWVIRTMDSSMAAIIGVTVIGGIAILIGAGRASAGRR